MNITLKPLKGEDAERALSDIRRVLTQFPGVIFSVKTFLAERVEETLSGYTASVAVNVVGNDLDRLDVQARQIANVLNRVKGAIDVQVQSPPGTPRLMVRLRQDSLLRWGFASVQVLEAIRMAYQGDVVGQIYEGNRIFNVAIILDPLLRKNIADIGRLPLRSPNGVYVLLKELADIYEDSGRYVVLHRGARRVQTVTCNVAGRDIASFVSEAKQHIGNTVALFTGNYVEFSGAAEAQARSARELMVHSSIAGIGIVLLLSIVMGNRRNLLLVMINLPFALVGGVLAVFFSSGELSIGSLVGFITLFGITLRNSVMLLSHYEHLVAVDGLIWGKETALRGAQERLTPIMMTALVTALGLLPLAIGSGESGREIEGPMAMVILGGLATSTLLNLLVLPGLALRYGQFSAGIKD
jgi:Cu/Ag efflux pump CusA